MFPATCHRDCQNGCNENSKGRKFAVVAYRLPKNHPGNLLLRCFIGRYTAENGGLGQTIASSDSGYEAQRGGFPGDRRDDAALTPAQAGMWAAFFNFIAAFVFSRVYVNARISSSPPWHCMLIQSGGRGGADEGDHPRDGARDDV